MSISFDSDLHLINLDVQDLIGLSEDEIKEKVLVQLPDLSPSEIQTFIEDLRSELETIEDELKNLQDGYEKDLDDSETVEGRARYENKLELVQEALDTIDTLDSATEAALARETFLNIETDQDIAFTYNSNDLNQLHDGDVINLTALAGAKTGIFDDETAEAELTDTNGDGFITYDDRSKTPDAAAQFAGQDVFVQVNAGDQITNISSSGETVTFTLVTKDGKMVTINVNGNSNIYLQGSDYMDTSLLDGLSEDVAGRLYDNNDTMSMYDRVHDDEISDSERLTYIKGYGDIVNADHFNGILSSYGITADFNTYSKIMDELFSYIDDSSADKSIDAVWNHILTSYTLDENMILALTLSMATYGDQKYFNLFAPVVSRLETELGYDPLAEEDTLSANAKTAIMLLELHSGGAGQLGGASLFWSTAFAEKIDDTTFENGSWEKHDTNKTAIQTYQKAISTIDWINETGIETTTLQIENEAITSAESEIDPTELNTNDLYNGVEDVSKLIDSVLQSVFASGLINFFSYSSLVEGITRNKLEELLEGFINTLADLPEPVTIETIRTTITDYISNQEPKHKDNISIAIMLLLKKASPDLYEQVIGGEDGDTFRRTYWNTYIDNGNDKPSGWQDLRKDWENRYPDQTYDM